jgi:hypothetical protein
MRCCMGGWRCGRTYCPTGRRVERQRTADEQGYFDLIILEGRVYGYWGIVTPALLVPVVAVWGLEVPPRLITVGVGVMNAGLLYVWLLRLHGIGWLRMRRALRVALTLLLALGSMQFWMVCDGGAVVRGAAWGAGLAAGGAGCADAAGGRGGFVL